MIIFMFLEPDEQLSQDLQSAIFFFGSSTAMLNPLIYGAFHLRSRKRPHSKSTSSYNNSSTSRMDNTLMTTFRRSHPRRSHEELAGQQANGNLTVPGTSHRREWRSMVMDLNNSIRVVPKNHKSSF
ncbi:g_PROTEIN_RECEP_F1_2 domain-containing protein [Caerostris darwini]|uniref:G_PROTEIN_RECEP_F1_2 domain-containing protein n=1 Tax=Caerostris darwini TaxID=1538125 RepID=A0AAV4QLE3_9ARAC|nr:g_PROTEIN_RECEP_F1_2 domain-containing protein [Caerostris darwini]